MAIKFSSSNHGDVWVWSENVVAVTGGAQQQVSIRLRGGHSILVQGELDQVMGRIVDDAATLHRERSEVARGD